MLLIFKRIINKILYQNEFRLSKGSILGERFFATNSELEGEVRMGTDVSCVSSRLNGKFTVGDKVRFENASLKGSFEIGKGCRIMGGVHLNGEVTIGKYTSLNGPNLDIESAINKVVIGNFCSIARNVSIQEFNHDPGRMTTYFLRKNLEKKHSKEDLVSKGPITIGHDVWIGTHCVILSGAEIGTGAVIAANSVVTGAIPPYAIAAGTPAKVIRYRFDEKTINELLESRWWDKDEAEVIEHYHAFAQKAGKGE